MSVYFRPNQMSYIKCSFLEISLSKSQIRFLNTGPPDLPQIYSNKKANFIRFLHRQYDMTDYTNHMRLLMPTIIVRDCLSYRIFSFFELKGRLMFEKLITDFEKPIRVF